MLHLSVSTRDHRQASWDELQTIKDRFAGAQARVVPNLNAPVPYLRSESRLQAGQESPVWSSAFTRVKQSARPLKFRRSGKGAGCAGRLSTRLKAELQTERKLWPMNPASLPEPG